MKILCALILAVWSLYGGEAWGQFSVTEISILKSLTNRDCVNNESPVWVFATQRWSCGPTGGVGDVTEVQGTSPISVSSGTGPVPVVSISANGIGPSQVDETANYQFSGTTYPGGALSTLPAAGTAKRWFWVTDCESTSSCASGEGTTGVWHYDDGASWTPIFPGGSVPNLASVMAQGNRYDGADCTASKAFIVAKDANHEWWRCFNESSGFRDIPVINGIPDAVNKVIYVRDGFSHEIRNITTGALLATVNADGTFLVENLKTTGAATGKKVVCVDDATGQLFTSSTGTDCSN